MLSIGTGFWQSMWNFQSAYESYHKDRVWLFHCQYDLKITPSCSWSGLVNNLGGSFSYTCPWNGHIAGMDVSTFNGVYKDRQFNFKCCHGTAPRKYCKWTSYAHGWNGDMDYKVQNGYYMAGASSYHSNYYEYVIFIHSFGQYIDLFIISSFLYPQNDLLIDRVPIDIQK